MADQKDKERLAALSATSPLGNTKKRDKATSQGISRDHFF